VTHEKSDVFDSLKIMGYSFAVCDLTKQNKASSFFFLSNLWWFLFMSVKILP